MNCHCYASQVNSIWTEKETRADSVRRGVHATHEKSKKSAKIYLPDSEVQALTGWLVQFKDVIGREPYPVTFPHQAKQAAVHWSNPWEEKENISDALKVNKNLLNFMDGWTEIASTITVALWHVQRLTFYP